MHSSPWSPARTFGLFLAVTLGSGVADVVAAQSTTRLTTLYAVPVSAEAGPVRLVAHATRAAPLVSGTALIWTEAIVPVADPVVERDAVLPRPAALAEAAVTEIELGAAAPNPSRDRARVPYALPEAGRVHLAVFDALGRRVAVLVDGPQSAGRHTAALPTDRLAPGLYHVRLVAGETVHATRLTVVR
ncbi:MAG: hypothetical protein CMM84_14585 [Rhodothermaceae bacterium]|nr:hypothetical protein [Rhodothermaceae bacterium]MBC12910.1 hypothetical protein [Rhodothermaceae bacterium]